MTCDRFTLRYNLQSSGWELVDDASAHVHARFQTRAAALSGGLIESLFAAHGGVLCIRGSDGCLESEHAYPARAPRAGTSVPA
ncbi:hypothetical protein LDO26_02805 [Luteimonas sp. BDR2-5]|uniref:hypothetical protein n=1 Tax=Proluteimonas luteida TaxID=2878685 RepID=UPI001E3564D1|nr:hypothetical protein [Luteimonas sp. BDR2-5]MCD9027144.1 hypothetical protein [Luteimonas sp. BDR2-5]